MLYFNVCDNEIIDCSQSLKDGPGREWRGKYYLCSNGLPSELLNGRVIELVMELVSLKMGFTATQ